MQHLLYKTTVNVHIRTPRVAASHSRSCCPSPPCCRDHVTPSLAWAPFQPQQPLPISALVKTGSRYLCHSHVTCAPPPRGNVGRGNDIQIYRKLSPMCKDVDPLQNKRDSHGEKHNFQTSVKRHQNNTRHKMNYFHKSHQGQSIPKIKHHNDTG